MDSSPKKSPSLFSFAESVRRRRSPADSRVKADHLERAKVRSDRNEVIQSRAASPHALTLARPIAPFAIVASR